MVRTVDLFREYPTTLTTLFNTCFLSNEFEEEFLDRELQNELKNTPSISKPRTTRPTITDWIYDPHQLIPNTSSLKGVYTRMKFYKIKESHDTKKINLTPVTENQKYWFYNKSCKKYSTKSNNISLDDNDSIISTYALVLPQSSISKEPIFRIEVCMKIYGINMNKSRIEIKLKVECCVKAWGVSSFVEKFLINSAKNTYNNWLIFTHEQLIKIKIKKENKIEINKDININNKDINIEIETKENNMDIIIDDIAIEKKQQKNSISLLNSRENIVQKRNVNINKENGDISIHNNDLESVNNIGNHIHHNGDIKDNEHKCGDIIHDESRGLNKRSVSLKVKVCRCGTRICPSIFLREHKKNNIDLMVDSRCKYVEKSLWCVIVVCCTMIILLTLHRYNSG